MGAIITVASVPLPPPPKGSREIGIPIEIDRPPNPKKRSVCNNKGCKRNNETNKNITSFQRWDYCAVCGHPFHTASCLHDQLVFVKSCSSIRASKVCDICIGERTVLCLDCPMTGKAETWNLHKCLKETDEVACPICRMDYKAPDLGDHVIQCAASKTVTCPVCHRDVLAQSLGEHVRTCVAEKPVTCPVCHTDVPTQVLGEHVVTCAGIKTITCPLCHMDVITKDMGDHINTCMASKRTSCPMCHSDVLLQGMGEHVITCFAMRPIGCPHCQDTVPSRQWSEHVRQCAAIPTVKCHLCRDNGHPSGASERNPMLTCPGCELSLSSEEFEEHQTTCEQHCPFCKDALAIKDLIKHVKQCPRIEQLTLEIAAQDTITDCPCCDQQFPYKELLPHLVSTTIVLDRKDTTVTEDSISSIVAVRGDNEFVRNADLINRPRIGEMEQKLFLGTYWTRRKVAFVNLSNTEVHLFVCWTNNKMLASLGFSAGTNGVEAQGAATATRDVVSMVIVYPQEALPIPCSGLSVLLSIFTVDNHTKVNHELSFPVKRGKIRYFYEEDRRRGEPANELYSKWRTEKPG
jgi:hypothetical protein